MSARERIEFDRERLMALLLLEHAVALELAMGMSKLPQPIVDACLKSRDILDELYDLDEAGPA